MKRFSLPWFTAAFSLAYVVVFMRELPLFVYYPLTREFHRVPFGGDHGPAMLWYGLIASAAIAAFAAAVVLRERWLPRVLIERLWLAPVLAMLATAYQLRFFFA